MLCPKLERQAATLPEIEPASRVKDAQAGLRDLADGFQAVIAFEFGRVATEIFALGSWLSRAA